MLEELCKFAADTLDVLFLRRPPLTSSTQIGRSDHVGEPLKDLNEAVTEQPARSNSRGSIASRVRNRHGSHHSGA